MTTNQAGTSRRPPTWQLALAAATVVVIAVAIVAIIAAAGDDETLTAGTTTTTTTTVTAPPSTEGGPGFSAPPPQSLATTSAPATTATTLPPTTEAPTTTASSSSTTTTEPRTRWLARPGPELETTSGDHGRFRIALVSARDRWRNEGPRDGYVFRTRPLCFCPVMDNEITVDDDGEVSGQRTVDGDPEPDPPSVEEIFEQLEDLVSEDPDRIRATFDVVYGYPVEFFVDPDERLVDDEHGREIDWLEV